MPACDTMPPKLSFRLISLFSPFSRVLGNCGTHSWTAQKQGVLVSRERGADDAESLEG